MVFAALYGLVGCWFISLLPVVCAELFGVEGLSTITGFMILMNAPGSVYLSISVDQVTQRESLR